MLEEEATSGDLLIDEPEASRSRGGHLWPCVGLVGLTLVFYWRITSTIGSRWPNDLMDGASFTWNIWFFQHALGHGHNPFVTHQIFYPEGAHLAFHTYIPLIGLVSWPFVAVFGLPATYSLVTLAGPALSGIATYLLAHHLVRNRWAALFAGAAYVMLPDRALRMAGHVNLNHTEFLPLGLLAVLAMYERPTRKRAVLVGLVVAGSLLLESIFTAFLLIAILVVALVRWRETRTRPYLVAWGTAIAVGFVVALPLVIPMVSELRSGVLDPIPGWGAANITSADLFSYVVPSPAHPIWGSTFKGANGYTGGERFLFPGFTVLALAAVGFLLWRSRLKRVLVALTATFVVLSFGPFLHVAGRQGGLFHYLGSHFALPLPFFVIHFVPILNGVRVPGRFGLMVDLLLGVVAAGGLTVLLTRAGRRFDGRAWVTPAIALLAIGLLWVECLPGRLPVLTSPDIPKPYEAIAADPGHGAVLDLPIQWRDGFARTGDDAANRDDTKFLYYATKHGKPLVGGMVARYPDAAEARLRHNPVYEQVRVLQGDAFGPDATFTVADLQKLGIGYVVGHTDPSVPAAFKYFASLHLPILANDGSTLVWKVPGVR